jgi:hypothetical protein
MHLVFTPYFVGLTIFCGIWLSFVYPNMAADSRFPIEYRIGKISGYFYMGGSIALYIIGTLFG